MAQGIRLGPFGPISPRTAERQLPEGGAQVADSVNLLSGEIRPIRAPLTTVPSLASRVSVYRAEYDGVEKWRGWTMDVDVAKVPLSVDVESRYVWTGDGPPKWSKFTNFNTEANDLTLGIPTPISAPTITPSGGSGSAVTRLYVYTFYSQDGEESAPSPPSPLTTDKYDATWQIGGWNTGGDGPINTCTGSAVYSAPSTTFTDAAGAYHWLRVGDQIKLYNVTPTLLVTTTVTEITSNTAFKVAGNYSSAVSWARVANWNTTGMTRRIYRSAGTNATFQLVAENLALSTATYNDTLLDSAILGDELITTNWYPPPVNLSCVYPLPSGALVGVAGNQLCFCEPYQAHAWLTEYQFGMEQEGVGLAAFGSTVIVGTKGAPYMADGVEPNAVSMQRIDTVWPCLSKRSMVPTGDGVLYATTQGLAYIGAQGPKMWSQPYFTREEWDRLIPSTMIAAVAEGKIFVRYIGQNETKSTILIFQPGEPIASLTTLAMDCVELYVDPRDGHLYIVDAEAVKQYDAAFGARIPFTWTSREYELQTPCNFGVARVEFVEETTAADVAAIQQAYDDAVTETEDTEAILNGIGSVNGGRILNNGSSDVAEAGIALNSTSVNGYMPPLPVVPGAAASVTFTLFSKGSEVFSKTTFDNEAFRLPAGFKSDSYYIQLTGAVRIKNVKVAETPDGLRAL